MKGQCTKTIEQKMKTIKSLHILESIITIAQALILFFFGLIQFAPQFRHCLKAFFNMALATPMPCINADAAGIFLQVDATVLTLTISLVAIMSGVLSDSHMGISFSDYYLNIRPRIYKQLVIIVLSLVYLTGCSICYWGRANYMVAAFLLCEILLVLMSTLSIYAVFGGKERLKREIEDYSVSMQTKDMNKKVAIVDIQNAFIEAFSQILANGKKDEFDEYSKVLSDITRYVWENRNSEDSIYTLEEYEKNCEKLLDVCTKSSNYDSKILYLRLLDSIYEDLYNLIREEKNFKQHESNVQHSFHIVSSYSFGSKILEQVNISDFENTIVISKLFYRMRLVEFVLYTDYKSAADVTKEMNRRGSSGTVSDLQAQLGLYVAKQQRKGNLPEISYWSREFYYRYNIGNIDYLDDTSKESLMNAVAYAGIQFTCGMLIQGQFDIVKKGLYIERMAFIWKYDVIEKKVILAVHAFLYYMAWREDEEAVGVELQQRAKEFAADKDVASSFREFLIRNDVADVLIDNLRSEWICKKNGEENERIADVKSREMNKVLQRFDFRMNGRGFRRLIVSEVIDDFCLFTIFYLNIRHRVDLDWLGDEYHNIEDYIPYISDNDRNRGNNEYDEITVEDRIRDYVYFLNADKLPHDVYEDEDDAAEDSELMRECDAEANRIFEILQNSIRSRYKKKKIKEARDKEIAYLKQHEEIEEKMLHWKQDIVNELRSRFGTTLNFMQEQGISYQDVKLFSYSTFTDMIDDRLDEIDLEHISAQLIDLYIGRMIETGCIKFRDKKRDFDDDQVYINYLKEHRLDMFVGSELLLRNSDYMKTEVFDGAVKDSMWVKALGCFYGAAIKQGSVAFYIRDIEVNVRAATIEDERAEKNDKDVSKLMYEPVQGVSLLFEKEELSDYISKERKIVEVTAKIGLKIYKNYAGIYFQNERMWLRY